MELEGKYKDFLYSHIVELLPMNNELRETIVPGMTVTQHQNIRKEYEQNTGACKKNVPAQKDPEFAGSLLNPEDTEGISLIVDMVQTHLPAFASDEEIQEWLSAPEKWGDGVWYSDENIEANYYKFDFENGCRLVAVRYKHSAPMYVVDSPKGYRNEKGMDGTFCGRPYFHLIYSADYLRGSDLYGQHADRHYTNNTVTVEFLMDFLKEMQEETDVYLEEADERQIPGQMDIFGLMDLDEEADLPLDSIIMAYNLEGSAVLRKVLDVVDDQSLDAEIIDEKVGKLLDSASPDERTRIEDALGEIFDCV